MKLLKEKILKDGVVREGNILFFLQRKQKVKISMVFYTPALLNLILTARNTP